MKKIIIALVLLVLVGAAWYGLSPFFMNKYVDDALPADTPSDQAVGDMPDTVISEPVPVVDTPAHQASGSVRIVKRGDEAVVRYEDYKTINGPDLRIYLANDLDAKDYVDLGPIKGTEGNINYPVPAGVDISRYRYVLTWCEDFAVLFNSADLSPIR